MQQITILIHCADQKGIIATVTDFILKVEGNIIYIDQHVDVEQHVFFMRLECELPNKNSNLVAIKHVFELSIAKDFGMSWKIHPKEQKLKMALFVSKYDHCLFDILDRYSAGELNVEIPLIVSNHENLEAIAIRFEIPFCYIPIHKKTKKMAKNNKLNYLRNTK